MRKREKNEDRIFEIILDENWKNLLEEGIAISQIAKHNEYNLQWNATAIVI